MHGLPGAALEALTERIRREPDERSHLLDRIVTKSTLARRGAQPSPRKSAKTERQALTFATALHIWASDDDARVSTHAQHPMLRDRAAIDIAITELAPRRVRALRWGMRYGVSS